MKSKKLLPDNFWLPATTPHSPPTSSDIAAQEAKYQITFPRLVVEILQTNPGGGKARKRFIGLQESELVSSDFRGGCNVIFYHSLDQCEHATDQLYLHLLQLGVVQQSARGFGGLFAFGADSYGDDVLCLDFRDLAPGSPPKVALATYEGVVQPVAETPAEFIDRLMRFETEDCYAIDCRDGHELWKQLAAGFDLDVPREFKGLHRDWMSDKYKLTFRLGPNRDGAGPEPFLDEPADCWILRVMPEPKFRQAIRTRLDELGTKWKVVYECGA